MTVDDDVRPSPPAAVKTGHGVDPIEAALRLLLQGHPGAEVAAVDGLASLADCPIPGWVRVSEDRIVAARTMLEMVVPADRVVVARLWGQARLRGSAVGPVRLQRQPERAGSLYMFDLRQRHGVMIMAFLESPADTDLFLGTAERPILTPRFARASKDAGAVYRWVDPALPEILGWAPEEMIGHRTLEFIHPDDQELGIANWLEMLESPGLGRRVRLRHRHRNGSWVWLEVTNCNRLSEAEHADILTETVDISEEMAVHEALRAREQLLAQLTDTVRVGLFHMDTSGDLLFANRRLQEITGSAIATTLHEQMAAVVTEDRLALEEAVRSVSAGAEADIEIAIRRGGGSLRHCTLSARPLLDDDGKVTGLTGCLDDVTAMVRARRELEAKAASDVLTGCLNREATLTALQELLDRPSARVGDQRRGTAVIFVDLDGFKQINDEFGHAAGDACLVIVTDRIRATIRSGDLLGRFGGDEFIVVCPDVSGPSEALEVARLLGRGAFGLPLDQAGAPIRASIGVAWTHDPWAQADRLVQAADTAMYESKRARLGEPVMAPG
ncbi:MAG TPA: sensor domain-containing diguanylate cyclase [Acidimicrobiales bacterium]|jgi:diguanylate cyclase (GGDEF)-like protein/PAS domain S-box-containing protein|nr:sensor domain-containing diguanylate cyclase [Acidimicrobiales bacterium]